ncbi:hypothetical protein TNCV_4640161 [Trichonephila clavipes]|nr:hypothetical protein TNCV_4640161 [Trichonephila clavipes]
MQMLNVSSVVTFVTVVRFLDIITRFNTHRSFSLNFLFRPLFCFPELVLLRCVHTAITLDTKLLETPECWDVSVTSSPARRVPTVWPLQKSERSEVYAFENNPRLTELQ